MLDSVKFSRNSSFIFIVLSIVGFTALWYSSFVTSLITGLIGLLTIFWFNDVWKQNKLLVIALGLFLIITFLDLLRTPTSSAAHAKLGLIVGLFFLSLGSYYFFRQSRKREIIFFVFVSSLVVLFINVISVGNYLLNKNYFDELLLQSKSIPVMGMHHIHFGIINASALFLIAGVIFFYTPETWIRKSLIGIGLLNLLAFHILSSRTGLIAFYSGVSIALLIYAFRTGAYKILFIGFLTVVLSLFAAGYLSTSFKNKIYNSIEDFESIQQGGKDINFKSMAMRLEAGKMCLAIIKQNPALGVGADAQDLAMQTMYESQQTLLLPINRVGPHNQFLEFGVKYGVLGIAVLLFYFLVILKPIQEKNYLFIGFACMILVSMLFESLFERQVSIYFISLFLGAANSIFNSHISEI
ncbi:MAG: hypothetical protein RLZZ337_953 [Bacteroidota bacterium]|jgi:O-antigen ligase